MNCAPTKGYPDDIVKTHHCAQQDAPAPQQGAMNCSPTSILSVQCISANLWEREKIIEYRRTLHGRTLQSTERRGRWLNLLLCSIQRWRWRRRRWSERLAWQR